MTLTPRLKGFLLTLPLTALLAMGVGGCAHQRLHHDLAAAHEDFHSEPHSRREHRRFHEDLEDYHRDAHERRYFGGAYDRYPY